MTVMIFLASISTCFAVITFILFKCANKPSPSKEKEAAAATGHGGAASKTKSKATTTEKTKPSIKPASVPPPLSSSNFVSATTSNEKIDQQKVHAKTPAGKTTTPMEDDGEYENVTQADENNGLSAAPLVHIARTPGGEHYAPAAKV